MVNKSFWHISDFFLASFTFGCVKMSDFMPNNCHLGEVLIFFLHSKKTAAEVHRELQKVYGDASLSETTCHDWFRRFRSGDFDVDGRPREERPKTFEDADVIYIMSRWNRTKSSLGNGIECNWCVWAEHCTKNGHNTSRGTKKWFYSISPSDYYLFRSIAHGLADQQFRSYEDIEKWLDSCIASKDEHFYRNGIRALPERWTKFVANDGQYFVWFICNHFFTIKLNFHKKNSGNLVAHLIYIIIYLCYQTIFE